MNAKIIIIVMMLSAVLAATASAQGVTQGITQNANQFAGGANVNQNINQNANQHALGFNNTTVNQTLNQRAKQVALGTGKINQSIGQAGNQYATGGNVNQNIGQTGNQLAAGGNVNQNLNQSAGQTAIGAGNVSQNIGQTGNQYAAGGNVNQNINQNANQTAISNAQYYFTMPERRELTTEERTTITSRAENFLVLYPQYRAFIMPVYDFQTIVTQRVGTIVVLDVSANGNAVIPAGYSNIIRIPLANLANNVASIPAGTTVAVISDNDINSAVAMTLLRMYGYNAWMIPVGVCDTQGTSYAYGSGASYAAPYSGTTGNAVSSSQTSQSQTVGGVTTGQTTGTYSNTNY